VITLDEQTTTMTITEPDYQFGEGVEVSADVETEVLAAESSTADMSDFASLDSSLADVEASLLFDYGFEKVPNF
jgi:hypothetical protein